MNIVCQGEVILRKSDANPAELASVFSPDVEPRHKASGIYAMGTWSSLSQSKISKCSDSPV